MEPPTRFAASPGTPLFPLSPERVNKLGLGAPASPKFGEPGLSLKPSLLSGSPESHFRHSRNNSGAVDPYVQGLVARFDGLSVKDYKAQSEVAIRRADMAREMAEMERDKSRREAKALDEEVRRMREEMRRAKKEIEDGREGSRKLAKRLEAVIDEYGRSKESHIHAVGIYEKEIRKTRKEAFKTGSSLVKLQEELKGTRNSLRITQSGFEAEKLKAARREQEAFTSQYQLIGVQEELERAKERIQLLETERDSLKTSLQEEEVARMAAEGQIALPAMEEDDEEMLLHSPRKSPRKPRLQSEDSEDKENRVPQKTLDLQHLHQELATERRMREKAQEQIDFMKMECQFQCCSCRIAEKDGKGYVHDMSFESEMERIRTLVAQGQTPPHSQHEDEDVEMTVEHHDFATEEDEPQSLAEAMEKSFHSALEPSQIPLPASDPEKGDITELQITEQFDNSMTLQDEPEAEVEIPPSPTQTLPEDPFTEPQTPIQIRTVTTTTTIPMLFSPYPVSQVPTTPITLPNHRVAPLAPASPNKDSAFKADGTLDREAALALIRERRGRARSMAMGTATPRKQMVEGLQGRRDISAPNRL